MPKATDPSARLRRRAALTSLVGAVLILGLKLAAYLLTGSVGFLSDAAESVVNLVAAAVLIVAIGVSVTPPDYRHPYGHAKAEYLSSVLEAALIVVAAAGIGYAAVHRLLHPIALENISVGLVIAALAAVVNGALARRLFTVARAQRSAALEANARHLLTDVWTSAGVIVGVFLVWLTGWQPIDPLIALVVAVNIVLTGITVMRRSFSRLLDERLPDEEESAILAVLDETSAVLGYHRLRTRRSGRARFAELDVFVDPEMSVAAAHDLMVAIEGRIRGRLGDIEMTLHVEPFEHGVRDMTMTPRQEFEA